MKNPKEVIDEIIASEEKRIAQSKSNIISLAALSDFNGISSKEKPFSNKKISEIISKIEEFMSRELETKTGWGRNEIKLALQRSINKALLS